MYYVEELFFPPYNYIAHIQATLNVNIIIYLHQVLISYVYFKILILILEAMRHD